MSSQHSTGHVRGEQDADEPGRAVGLLEHLYLSSHLFGYVSSIGFFASLDHVPTREVLHSAISRLAHRYPLLRAHVPEAHASIPQFALETFPPSSILHVHDRSYQDIMDLVMPELAAADSFDIRTGPLWRVALAVDIHGASCKVGLTIHHMIIDGRGGSNLFGEFLSLLSPSAPALPDLVEDPPKLAPAFEATTTLKPSLLLILRALFDAFVIDKLPFALLPASYLPLWVRPALPRVTHRGAPSAVLMQISGADVQALKAVARAHGVRTLQPVLYTATLAALHTVLDPEDAHCVLVRTPMSLRTPELGHPAATGNFVGDLSAQHALAPASLFWETARAYAASITGPAARATAQAAMGILTLLPDPAARARDGRRSLDVMIEGQLNAGAYRASVLSSNAGVVPGSAESVREVVFAQVPIPLGAALNVNLIGMADGPLSVTAVCREDILKQAQLQRFKAAFDVVVASLLAGSGGEDVSFHQLSLQTQ